MIDMWMAEYVGMQYFYWYQNLEDSIQFCSTTIDILSLYSKLNFVTPHKIL